MKRPATSRAVLEASCVGTGWMLFATQWMRYTVSRISLCTAVVYQRGRLFAVPYVHAGPPAADLCADRPARVIGVQWVIRETA